MSVEFPVDAVRELAEACEADEALALSLASRAWHAALAPPYVWARYLRGPPQALAQKALAQQANRAFFAHAPVHASNFRALVASLRAPGWEARYPVLQRRVLAGQLRAPIAAASWRRRRAKARLVKETKARAKPGGRGPDLAKLASIPLGPLLREAIQADRPLEQPWAAAAPAARSVSAAVARAVRSSPAPTRRQSQGVDVTPETPPPSPTRRQSQGVDVTPQKPKHAPKSHAARGPALASSSSSSNSSSTRGRSGAGTGAGRSASSSSSSSSKSSSTPAVVRPVRRSPSPTLRQSQCVDVTLEKPKRAPGSPATRWPALVRKPPMWR